MDFLLQSQSGSLNKYAPEDINESELKIDMVLLEVPLLVESVFFLKAPSTMKIRSYPGK